eukprot:COSAG01_NODE_4047_length_5403_cov_2.337670_8_plen_103_part_00
MAEIYLCHARLCHEVADAAGRGLQVGKKQIEEMEEKEATAVVKATSDQLIGREMMKDQDFASAKEYLTDALAAALKTRSKDLQEEIRSQIKCDINELMSMDD